MADCRIRSKGRHKLISLMREALNVCRKYDHDEYADDFRSVIRYLNHDASVELETPGKD